MLGSMSVQKACMVSVTGTRNRTSAAIAEVGVEAEKERHARHRQQDTRRGAPPAWGAGTPCIAAYLDSMWTSVKWWNALKR